MRATINLEFTDDELLKYAEDAARRAGLNFIHDTLGHLSMLKVNPDVVSAIAQVAAQAFGAMVSQRVDAVSAPLSPAEVTPPPPQSTATKCERIEPSMYIEEGWLCHCCTTYNGLQRPVCRHCAHERCDIIVPLAPAEVVEPTATA